MAGIIKNQILKHLSKFAKNLSPDRIQLSTLKGVGDLQDLELNEDVLMEVIDLPSWLRVTKANCNRLHVKIQWTKLKSQPICIFLDEVVIDMETCEHLRPMSPLNSPANLGVQSGYGFAEKVVDGIFVCINSVVVNFSSRAFHACLQLSRVQVRSMSPTWQVVDLRMTRIRDVSRGEVLTFKEVEWQTLRIEANAVENTDMTTPLRLITNQARCRVTLKKRLSDCSVVTSRLQLILDDLLWVLTDTQLKAALHFVNSLKSVIAKANEASKARASKHLQVQVQNTTDRDVKVETDVQKFFTKFDVVETSYHVYCGRIDLHLCEDSSPNPEVKLHSHAVEGGAMQVTLYKLIYDFYPFHVASGDRKHWVRYSEGTTCHHKWVKQLLDKFREQAQEAIRLAHQSSNPSTQASSVASNSPNAKPIESRSDRVSPKPAKSGSQLRLMSNVMILRLDDFVVGMVTYHGQPQDPYKRKPKFFVSDKHRLYLPPDLPAFHAERIDYYFPQETDFPVPCPNLCIQVNPVRLTVDYMTIIWLNSFLLNLRRSIILEHKDRPPQHADIRIEALMPRLVVPAEKEVINQPERPKAIQIQVSNLVMTNCRIGDRVSRSDLSATLDDLTSANLWTGQQFPNCVEDTQPISERFRTHACGQDDPVMSLLGRTFEKPKRVSLVRTGSLDSSPPRGSPTGGSPRERRKLPEIPGQKPKEIRLSQGMFNTLAQDDIWSVTMDQFWIDYIGAECWKGRPVSFVEAFPVTLWLHRTRAPPQAVKRSPRIDSLSLVQDKQSCHPKVRSLSRTDRRKLLKQYYSLDDEHYNVPNYNESDLCSDSSTCDVISGGSLDVYCLVHIQTKVYVQMTHYQYLMTLRLVQSVSSLLEKVEEDTQNLIPTQPPAAFVACTIVPSVEFAMLCLTLPSEISQSSSSILGSLNFLSNQSSEDKTMTNNVDEEELPTLTSESLAEGHETIISRSAVPFELANAAMFQPVGLSFGIEESTVISSTVPSMISPAHSAPSPAHSILSYMGAVPSPAHSMHEQISNPVQSGPTSSLKAPSIMLPDRRGSPSGQDGKTVTYSKDVIGGDLGSRKGKGFSLTNLDSLSKGFSSLKDRMALSTSNLLDADGTSSLGDEETLSMHSDLSDDDSDQFVMVAMETSRHDDGIFAIKPGNKCPSIADSLVPDDASETSSAKLRAKKDWMSVISWTLNNIEVAVETQKKDLKLKLQCSEIKSHEWGNINYEDFHSKFSYKTEADEESVVDVKKLRKQQPVAQLRFISGPCTERLCPGAEDRGFLQVATQGLELQLLMSSLTGMIDLIEDEIITPPLPMELMLHNTKVRLQDDRPPNNITSPGPVPIILRVDAAVVMRDLLGVFHFKPTNDESGNTAHELVSKATQVAFICPQELPCKHKITQTDGTIPTIITRKPTVDVNGVDSAKERVFAVSGHLDERKDSSVDEKLFLKRSREEIPEEKVQKDERTRDDQGILSPEYRLSPDRMLGANNNTDRERRSSLTDLRRDSGSGSDLMRRDSDRIKYQLLIKEHCANMDYLRRENEQLKKDMQKFLGLSEENSRLRDQLEHLTSTSALNNAKVNRLLEENCQLKEETKEMSRLRQECARLEQKVLSCEDDLDLMDKEKSSLMQTLQLLQEELLQSERNSRGFQQQGDRYKK